MLSDEQVMRIVRVRLDHDPAALLPPEDLLDRVRDQAHNRRLRPVRHRRSDVMALSLSVMVVVIVAGALVTIGGSRHPRGAATSTGSGIPALLAKLSVLHGPQTAAARHGTDRPADTPPVLWVERGSAG